MSRRYRGEFDMNRSGGRPSDQFRAAEYFRGFEMGIVDMEKNRPLRAAYRFGADEFSFGYRSVFYRALLSPDRRQGVEPGNCVLAGIEGEDFFSPISE